MDQRPVSFSAAEPGSRPRNSELWWGAEEAVRAAAVRCEGNPEAMLRTLESSGEEPPVPAAGQTQRLWELLASVAATDLVAARTLEPHLDAAGILSQAGMSWPAG
ncbi:MAG TPA: acyl-CoA dehydrogenase, partial [Glutamicibacter sp.]|nr:acyl-CoA dehydrogenase [Glutamicibacter sp.]